MIHIGDCLEVLKDIADNSIDSIVTDPPYGISFMAKRWDYDVPSVEVWRECMRVLKPGGHMLVACGTRTQHRMVVNIEDAGFEIRDVVTWLYGQGFPKALDCAKQAIKEGIACDCKPQTEHELRPLPNRDLSSPEHFENERGQVLQSSLQEQSPLEHRQERPESGNGNGEKPSLERRQVYRTGEGLCDDSIPGSSTSETQWLRPGTHSDSRENVGQAVDGNGSGSPLESQPGRQSARESESLQRPQRALDGSSFPRCSRCERPIFPEGWKSALKPACEFWTLARKPMSEPTVAKNVLKWGTGGINVDGCRVKVSREDADKTRRNAKPVYSKHAENTAFKLGGSPNIDNGRFPANLILDEHAAAMLDEQAGIKVSRFFYAAKASVSERNAGLEHRTPETVNDGRETPIDNPFQRGETKRLNTHPTVKPVALMAYLCRLITPPGGTVLDPFAGSGSTGVAAIREGFAFVGIEREAEYAEIAKARINAAS